MIYLEEDIEYYMLGSNRGSVVYSHEIYESLREVKESFILQSEFEWDSEVFDPQVIAELPIGECLELWECSLYRYDGTRFSLVEDEKILKSTGHEN